MKNWVRFKRVVVYGFVTFLLATIHIVGPHRAEADIFDPSSSTGSGVFDGFLRSLDSIFSGLRGAFPGGAVIPGLIPTPTPPVPPEDVIIPLPDTNEKIKLSLEWDALSMGGEAAAPAGLDPLSSIHATHLICPQCGTESESSFDGCEEEDGTTTGTCGQQIECSVGEARHVLYGWCGHEPFYKDKTLVAGPAQVAYPGPNSYTLPNAVSNKYIRRDGYYYQCVRACAEDGNMTSPDGLCVTHNYTEFQTMVYPSNAVSLYIKAQNPGTTEVKGAIVKVHQQYTNFPLPHNLDYPTSGTDVYRHGNTVSSFSTMINGVQLSVVGTDIVFGPFDLPPGQEKLLPLQLPDSEWSAIPGSEAGGPGGQKGNPETKDPDEWCACVAGPLADYINAMINAPLSNNIQLLSPAFNLSSVTFECLIQALIDAGANLDELDGFAGNAYNLGPGEGQSLSDYVDRLVDEIGEDAKIILTEIGMKEIETGTPRDQALQNLINQVAALQGNDQIEAMLLFNAFGNNPDPNFTYNHMNNAEIQQVCGGNCDGIGINTASGFTTQSAYDQAASLGMSHILEIANSNNINAVINGMNQAFVNGMTPIIRIGVGADSGGFDNPQDYANFLQQISDATGGKEFFAIAGPNEPDLEPWAAPECGVFGQVPTDPNFPLGGQIGKGGIVPRDFNFICDPSDPMESARCSGGDDQVLIKPSMGEFDLYRDVTGVGGCGYNASSNNSVIGPIEVIAEFGGQNSIRSSRSVLLGSIPVGGRLVDDQSRPYGWPTTGEITQDWGFTGKAEAEGDFRNTPSQEYGEYRMCVSQSPPNNPLPGLTPFPTPGDLAECNAPSDPDPNDNQCVHDAIVVSCALNRAARKYNIDPQILQAVYEIEASGTAATNPATYTCSRNSANALGYGQVTNGTYNGVTTDAERMNEDGGVCNSPEGKMSRCDPVDAFELMARVLLSKVGRLRYSDMSALGGLQVSEKDITYNATCRYYGSFRKDCATCRYGYNLPNASRTTLNPICNEWGGGTGLCPLRGVGFSDNNYCDIVCNKLGTCPPYPAQQAQ